MQDKLEKERADSKNAVEEYVYDMRDKLGGPFEQFASEEVRLGVQRDCNTLLRQGTLSKFQLANLWLKLKFVKWLTFV